MPFDDVLAGRIRDVFLRQRGIVEKKMFGGLAFLMNGNLCVGVIADTLIARVGVDNYDEALAEPNVREFDFTGRPMHGWIVVEAEGIEDDDELARWVRMAMEFVKSLPVR